MKKVICFIFGHLPYTYNSGTQESPEQAWSCSYCKKDLTQGDEFWGLNLNIRVTKYLFEISNKKKNIDLEDMPF